MKILKGIFLLAVILSSASCRIYSLASELPPNKPIQSKLPAVEKSVDNSNTNTSVTSDDRRIFDYEVEENLTVPSGDKYGYIILSYTNKQSPVGIGGFVVNCVTLFIPSLVGVPVGGIREEIEVEVQLLDSKHQVIIKYKETATDKEYCALYWGYMGDDMFTKAHAESLKECLAKIRQRIQNDSPLIKQGFEKAGPIPK